MRRPFQTTALRYDNGLRGRSAYKLRTVNHNTVFQGVDSFVIDLCLAYYIRQSRAEAMPLILLPCILLFLSGESKPNTLCGYFVFWPSAIS